MLERYIIPTECKMKKAKAEEEEERKSFLVSSRLLLNKYYYSINVSKTIIYYYQALLAGRKMWYQNPQLSGLMLLVSLRIFLETMA